MDTNIDPRKEARRVKWMMRAAAVFLISGFFAWTELRYHVWGKTIDANVSATREHNDFTAIDYQFKDAAGNFREETDQVPADWDVPATNTKVHVEYLGSSSRIVGHSSMVSVYVFLVCVGLLVLSLVPLLHEAYFPKR